MSKHSQTRTNPGESKKATEKVYSYDMKGKDIKTNTNGQQTNNKQTKIIQRILCKLEEHHFLFHFLKNK